MALPDELADLDVAAAAQRLEGVVRPTRLAPFDAGDARVELRLKLECTQETGSFKARGAANQLACLSERERAAGVVATSSGNHGKALAWAARRAGVRATIVMPADAYPNKIAACREFGAEVLLGRDRAHAEALCAERVAAGATLVHPYDAARTIQGAGTVAREILEQWPEVEAILVPVGGGGLLAGTLLACRGPRAPSRAGGAVRVLGVEPRGANTLGRALEAGQPVRLERVESQVQGLCPPALGARNLALCLALGVEALTLEDDAILDAQRELVQRGGWVVEPAGAAAVAAVLSRALPAAWLDGRARPLRAAAIVSGGNPDPAQLEGVRAARRPAAP